MNAAFRKLSTVALSTAFLFASCTKDKQVVTQTVKDPVFNLRGNANGDQEAPNRVTTTATGTISGTYNKETNVLTYTINWTGLSGNPAAMHFHGAADPGKAAGVAIGITGFPAATTGSISGVTPPLTDAQETELVNGQWYYNIHTAANPGGEIRGQIFLTQ